MTRLYNILRSIIITVLLLLVAVPTVSYVVLSIPSVQDSIRRGAAESLSGLLGAKINIGKVDIAPFNRLTLRDITIVTAPGDTTLAIERLGAGIRIGRLILDRRIDVSYAEIIGLDCRLWRANDSADINIRPIIDKLSKPDKQGSTPEFDLSVNNIVLRQCRLSYDIADAPLASPGTFDSRHIHVYDLKADITLPRISTRHYDVMIRRLALREQSGLTVENLEAHAAASDSTAEISAFSLRLPGSELAMRASISYPSISEAAGRLFSHPVNLEILPPTHIRTADLAPLLPAALSHTDATLTVEARLTGTPDSLSVERLDIRAADAARLYAADALVARLSEPRRMRLDIPSLTLDAYAPAIAALLPSDAIKPYREAADSIGHVAASLSASGAIDSCLTASATIATAIGSATAKADARGDIADRTFRAAIDASLSDVRPGSVVHLPRLGAVCATAALKATVSKGAVGPFDAQACVSSAEYAGRTFTDIRASAVRHGADTEISLLSANEGADFSISTTLHTPRTMRSVRGDCRISDLNPHLLALTPKYEGYSLSGRISLSAAGADISSTDGRLEIDNLLFADSTGSGPALDHLSLLVSGSPETKYMLIHSDMIDGRVRGHYRLESIPGIARGIVSTVLPSVIDAGKPHNRTLRASHIIPEPANLDLEITLRETQTTRRWLEFFNSPVGLLHAVTVKASLNEADSTITAAIDAPYLIKKDKFIDRTSATLTIDGREGEAYFHATTLYPTKKGNTALSLYATAAADTIVLNAGWEIEGTERRFNGDIALDCRLWRNPTLPSRPVEAVIGINKSKAVFNDTVWTLHPGSVMIADGRIDVLGFDASRDNQFIRINGSVSADPDRYLDLQLRDIDLNYIFETLAINHVSFGGIATGNFRASRLLGREPSIATPGLHVSRFSYNGALLGDAVIESHWDNASRGIALNADIASSAHGHSYVNGAIYPLADSLDLRFRADSLNAALIKPFLSGFTSDVSGYATGKARLFGSFKTIDLEGDLMAEGVRLRLDYTNAYYSASDSIHFRPGLISLRDVTLRDDFGHTARLDGQVNHRFFKNMTYDFRLTGARSLLCYDITERMHPDWYGRIFCNGEAFLQGRPGFVDVAINVSTAPQSTFTFVLSDTEAAGEYTFLKFHDREEMRGKLLLSVEAPEKATVRRLKERFAQQRQQQQQGRSSVFRINIQADINPQADMTLVMDPASGDRIRARGNGNMRLEYVSTDDDFRMFGKYALTQGQYKFTLQDIIIKDFTIKPESSISFNGNPLDADLDISAFYTVNANLSDLDESFLQDKDLNRTNVPVHAVLNVNGDMSQPDITFDLEFPTLTQDTDRKVHSIVSTDDMMNRQIIYLLALNRFYTPDYMGATTKGSELVSVASSTINSQLGSILGQLSDKWSIAPNFRSDRGDFSDMEVDLALSSYLLNNRLLFNGNFGYRDNALNNNTFVGDFDIEYLLNKSGNIRLKAYNRYNDQNYFVKSALTTQGVGVVFKRDFDEFFPFLKKKPRRFMTLPAPLATPDDTTATPAPPANTVTDDPLVDFRRREPVDPD